MSRIIEHRPWGVWELLHRSDNYAVKRLIVLPEQRLSLQYHLHRDEQWYCVSGQGIVVLDGAEIPFTPGDTINIPVRSTHRIINPSMNTPLTIVEVQVGFYLEEDDIIRLEDDYER